MKARRALENLVIATLLSGCATVPYRPPTTPIPQPTQTPIPRSTPFPTPMPIPVPLPTPRPISTPPHPVLSKPAVAVFAGHTSTLRNRTNGPGSRSASGQPEYQFNDGLITRLGELSNPAAAYVLFPASQNVPLTERPQRAVAEGASLYIEIHHDSAQLTDIERLKREGKSSSDWRELSGFSVFYNTKNGRSDESRRLATLIAQELKTAGFKPNLYHAKPIPGESRTLLNPDLGIYEGSHLFVLRENLLPAALVEGGVIVNPFEEKNLRDPTTQKRLATAVDRAVAAYSSK
ncbi:MAG: N-acetylmuramoyl-L-alanine amidase [Nanoarchaeota archaeon]